jgi:MoaA/NifB/PqqE/SkfB family radical SAM enzyme
MGGAGVTARWWLEDGPLSFTWDLWYACNYRCSYCWWEQENLWDKLAKEHKLLSPEEWLCVWRRIGDDHGEATIDVLGGEPLIYPRAAELLARLSEIHQLRVTTNLSIDGAKLAALIESVSPERVHFNASFHPEFTPFDAFLGRVLRLQDAGFDPAVLFVPYPPLVEKMAGWREACQARGVPFSVMIFQGAWEGKTYPDAFTDEQKEAIGLAMNNEKLKDAEVKYRLERGATRGKLCHSGRVYANVKANGDVYRCGQDAFGRQPMGNLFDPAFRLYDAPRPCPYERCSCLEFKFLDEIMACAEKP